MRHVSDVVSGWGWGMFAVTFVGCWASWLLLLVLLFTRLLIILAVISPLSALGGFRLPWWFRGRLPPSVSLWSLLSFFLWLGCSYIDWSLCCCPCFLVVGGRGLRWLYVASPFPVVLWGRSFFFAILYPSFPYRMSLVPCMMTIWSYSWGGLFDHCCSCSVVKISFSWCHVARLRSRNGIISHLLESATSRHLGFVVGSAVSVSSSLSGCLSSFSNSMSVRSSASFSFCFSSCISACWSWGCYCCCCCCASSSSFLRLWMVTSLSSWLFFMSWMVLFRSLMSFSSCVIRLSCVVSLSLCSSVSCLLVCFSVFISSCLVSYFFLSCVFQIFQMIMNYDLNFNGTTNNVVGSYM